MKGDLLRELLAWKGSRSLRPGDLCMHDTAAGRVTAYLQVPSKALQRDNVTGLEASATCLVTATVTISPDPIFDFDDGLQPGEWCLLLEGSARDAALPGGRLLWVPMRWLVRVA